MGKILQETPAFVIHRREYQENSLLIEFFTLNHGRVAAVAKHVKSSKSALKFLLQPFIPLTVSFVQGKSDLFLLNDVSSSGAMKEFVVPRLFCASYLNELLYYLYKSKESDPKLFACYLNSLNGIEGDGSIDIYLRDFEFNLLESLGFAIRFSDHEGNNLKEDAFYKFVPDIGFIEAYADEQDAVLGSNLILLANRQYLNNDVLKCARHITHKVLRVLLGTKEIKSRSYYQSFLKIKG